MAEIPCRDCAVRGAVCEMARDWAVVANFLVCRFRRCSEFIFVEVLARDLRPRSRSRVRPHGPCVRGEEGLCLSSLLKNTSFGQIQQTRNQFVGLDFFTSLQRGTNEGSDGSWLWDDRIESICRTPWVATEKLTSAPRHVFYERLNRLLTEAGFDKWLETRCRRYSPR
jgi:hypothetical protein